MLRIVEGSYESPKGAKFVLVSARFNHFITDRLVEGALDGLARHGVEEAQIQHVRVPGAFELPLIVADIAKNHKPDAIIALGAVIRGSTAHFDFVAGEAAKGCANVALQTSVPVIFGVLTTDTIEQAIERAGTKAGNKGFEAATTAIEIVNLRRSLAR